VDAFRPDRPQDRESRWGRDESDADPDNRRTSLASRLRNLAEHGDAEGPRGRPGEAFARWNEPPGEAAFRDERGKSKLMFHLKGRGKVIQRRNTEIFIRIRGKF
jgi:hypothetical protein